MRMRQWWLALVVYTFGMVAASTASAQVIGQFRWQFAPFCNTVTLTIEVKGPMYELTGFDDMCGGPKRGAATGLGQVNPDGTIGLAITVVRPDGFSVQHAAVVTLAALSGTWTDDSGNSGTFAFNAPSPSPGAPRPVVLRGVYGARDNATTGTLSAFQVLAPISFGRTLPITPQAQFIPVAGAPTAQCPGATTVPQAAAGYLCVYEQSRSNRELPVVVNSIFGFGTADRVGALVLIANTAAGLYGSSGTWAVAVP